MASVFRVLVILIVYLPQTLHAMSVKMDSEQDVLRMDNTEYGINQKRGFYWPEMVVAGETTKHPRGRVKRGALPVFVKWPKMNGELIIPYVFHRNIPKHSQKRQRIQYFIDQMNSFLTKCNGNVWRPRKDETHYVVFQDSTGCSSHLGRISERFQPQIVNLTDDCVFLNDGTVLHEMLHTMGFTHEHQRLDRDLYVKVDLTNILPGQNVLFNFLKFFTDSLGSPYEIGSVMHYGPFFFAKDASKPVITRLTSSKEIMGQRFGMTEIDKDQLNAYYGCIGRVTITTPPKGSLVTPLPPNGPEVLKFCNWKKGYSCNSRSGFKLSHDGTGRTINAVNTAASYYTKRGFRLRRFQDNFLYVKGSQRNVRRISKCRCPDRIKKCESVKYCVLVSYQRRADLSENVWTPSSEMKVCLRNCHPKYDCLRRYRNVGCQDLVDNDQERNRWKTASFEFTGKCKGVMASVAVKKGIDQFQIRQILFKVGRCPK